MHGRGYGEERGRQFFNVIIIIICMQGFTAYIKGEDGGRLQKMGIGEKKMGGAGKNFHSAPFLDLECITPYGMI